LDGKATTSTGTKTLDALFAGHGGLPLGSSVIVEETGTTDFGGSLLKYYAAEGLVQKHYVHVLGVGEHWGRELPGLQEPSKASLAKKEKAPESERMKIAWRYERLGQVDRGVFK
jgi:elongator complex protein 4